MKKDGQKRQFSIPKVTFNSLESALECLNIPFSKKHNALYGIKNMVLMLSYMCKTGCNAEAASIELRDNYSGVSTADTMLSNLQNLGSPEHVISKCNKMLERSVQDALKNGISSAPSSQYNTIAIDKHKVGRYDKNADMRYLIYSKPEHGTKRFEAYITSQLVGTCKQMVNGLTLGCLPVTRIDENVDFVRKLVEKVDNFGIKNTLFLLDREFYATDIIKQFQTMGRDFIIPVKKNKKIDALIEQLMFTPTAFPVRSAVAKYTVKSTTDSATYTLVVVRAKGESSDKYYAFATSLKVDDPEEFVKLIPQEYRRRWGIETGYRTVESIRARTRSKNPVVRIVMFYYTLVLCNIWESYRWLREHSTIIPSYQSRGRQAITIKRLLAWLIGLMTQALPHQIIDPG